MLIAAAALSAPAIAQVASGAVTTLINDTFTYPNGNLVGQGGWTQTSTTATSPIQVTSNAAVLGVTGQDVYDPFSAGINHDDGASITSDFTINATAAGSGEYFFHLSNPVGTTSNFYERFFGKASGSGFVLGITDTTAGTTEYGTTVLAFSAAHTVDIVWNFVAGTLNDTFAITVDGSSYLNHAWSSLSAEPTVISAANLRQASSGTSTSLSFDDLTVTSTASTVAAPEPTSLAALGFGAAALLRRRKN